MDIKSVVSDIMTAGIGAQAVFALVDADDAELRFAVVDDSMPGGGYVKAFPLMAGKTYLIVPLKEQPEGIERGMHILPQDKQK